MGLFRRWILPACMLLASVVAGVQLLPAQDAPPRKETVRALRYSRMKTERGIPMGREEEIYFPEERIGCHLEFVFDTDLSEYLPNAWTWTGDIVNFEWEIPSAKQR